MWKAIKNWVAWYAQEITAIMFFVVITVVLMSGMNALHKRYCYRAYAQFQPEYVGMITGCMITVDEQRVPADSLRMTL